MLMPLVPMYTLGHDFVPPSIHAGGLRYHGDSPLMCQLVKDGIIEAAAYHQNEVFEAAVNFSQAEGFIPGPEPAHAVKATLDEALRCKEEGKEKTIIFNNSGHGHFDMGAYDAYFAKQLVDYPLPEEEIQRALKAIEGLPKPK